MTRTSLGRAFGVLFAIASFAAAQQPDPQQPPAAPPPYPSQQQQPPPDAPLPPDGQQPQPPPAQPLSPDQLDDLVAPIALYPDNLLSQIMVACTYPLEVVEAQQWLQGHRNLSGQALLDAAHQQDWDPSIQALVAFPDVLGRLNQDVRWTTDLGNAFLAQQADVMTAVQRMRARAQQNGKLQSSPQEAVTTQTQDGQSAIEIQPTDPQQIYVPSYNPAYIWGPPAYGYYPPLLYPGIGIGFSWGPGIYIGGFFGGCCGWGDFGWGWGPGWFDHRIFVNNYFMHRYGFGDFHGGDFRGTGVWAHDPGHRLGVPYPNRGLANQYRGENLRGGAGGRNFAAPRGNFNASPARGESRGGVENRGGAAPAQRFGSSGFERQNPGGNRSVFGGIQNGSQQRIQSDHGFSSMGSRGGGGGFRGGGGAPRGGGGRH